MLRDRVVLYIKVPKNCHKLLAQDKPLTLTKSKGWRVRIRKSYTHKLDNITASADCEKPG